jgi:hypothetical protein
MTDQPDGLPFSESNLDSAEYRERLMRKLNCLIAVLEVAAAKVRRSLAGPAPDVERLTRIKKNLQDTLEVCMRARTALEKRGKLPEKLSKDLQRAVNPEVISSRPYRDALTPSEPPRGARVEMTSEEEHEKFRALGRIDLDMIGDCDIEDLARQLQG